MLTIYVKTDARESLSELKEITAVNNYNLLSILF